MKKKIVFLITFVSVMATTLVGCGNAIEPVTPEEFTEILSDYEIYDDTEYCQEYYSSVEVCYDISLDDEWVSTLEYLEFDSTASAGTYYLDVVDYIESFKTGSYTGKSSSRSTQGKITLTSGDMYYVGAWSGNTIVYGRVETEYKNEVNEILDKIGY